MHLPNIEIYEKKVKPQRPNIMEYKLITMALKKTAILYKMYRIHEMNFHH